MSAPALSPTLNHPPVRLAIVGASARAAAASALRAGFTPIAADLFADRDLQRICSAARTRHYPWGFANWLAEADVDGWMYTGGLENYPDLVEQLSRLRPLWGNPADVLRAVRDLQQLAAAIDRAGLLFPETKDSPSGLPCDGTWLVKPCRSSGGTGVWLWDVPARSGQRHTKHVWQKRVEGLPIAALFIAARGEAELVGVSEQLVGVNWTRAAAFQYCGSIGPWRARPEQLAAFRVVGTALAQQFPLVGLFGVDMIAAADGIWALEVNPRYTASAEVLERALDVRLVQGHIDACRDAVLPGIATPSNIRTVGKAILFAHQSVRVARDFSDWAEAESRRAPWPAMADVPLADTVVAAGRPVVTVFAAGDTAEEVRAELRSRIEEAEARLYRP